MTKFFLYVLRWQLSTPILWIVVSQLGTSIEATMTANLIGASIFFWVDRLIFKAKAPAVWELLPAGACTDCGKEGRVRRLVFAPGGKAAKLGTYDRREDHAPEYRCRPCSIGKLNLLQSQGKIAPVAAVE